jgi:hypothetical protein
MDDIFSIIGRLYVELLQSQKIIAELQNKLNENKINDDQ